MPPDLLHGDRVRRRAVLLASGGGADLDGEQTRDARRDGNIDLLHARGGGGFSGVGAKRSFGLANLTPAGGGLGIPVAKIWRMSPDFAAVEGVFSWLS